MPGKEIGATAYAAYWHFAGGKSLVTGDVLPLFQNLSGRVQDAWEAAGQAVLREHALTERQRLAQRAKAPQQ